MHRRVLRDLCDRPWWSIVLHVLPFVAIAALPILGNPAEGRFGNVLVNILLIVEIYMILALGLNVVVGYAGLLDLGYVTFLATGAVISCLMLMIVVTPEGWVLPGERTQLPKGEFLMDFEGGYVVILLVAGAVCAVLGVLRGIPTLRLSGDYYAIVTLGLAEIVYLLYFNEGWLTGGAFGMKLRHESRPLFFGERLYYDSRTFYYLVFGVLLLTIYAVYALENSRVGRAWAAIRLDETASRACGIQVSFHKTLAFGVSGFLGGVGGALYTVWSGTVAVRDLDIWQSFVVLCAVVLGGMGSIRGVLLGTVILISPGEVLRFEFHGVRVPPEARYLIYGVLLLILMRFRPQGLIPRARGGYPPTPEEEQVMRSKESPLYVLQCREEGRE